jgi:hypothetical protein
MQPPPTQDPFSAAQAPPAKTGMSGGVKLLIGCLILVPLLVCCLGIVSATAIPAFLSYVARSKTAEATMNVGQLSSAVQARCGQRQPQVPAGPLPLAPGATKQAADFGADPGFAALAFNPGGPVYYRYSVLPQADGTTVVRAEGDLDADGALSLFEVTCAPSCECSALYTENEIE